MKDEDTSPVDLEIVAVIAAALAIVLDKPHKVVTVKPVVVPMPHLNVWAFEGRIELTMSHRIR
jgi:phenylpyruvate tautomerase PptA (4-oxalocrotonate tautomerase family)